MAEPLDQRSSLLSRRDKCARSMMATAYHRICHLDHKPSAVSSRQGLMRWLARSEARRPAKSKPQSAWAGSSPVATAEGGENATHPKSASRSHRKIPAYFVNHPTSSLLSWSVPSTARGPERAVHQDRSIPSIGQMPLWQCRSRLSRHLSCRPAQARPPSKFRWLCF